MGKSNGEVSGTPEESAAHSSAQTETSRGGVESNWKALVRPRCAARSRRATTKSCSASVTSAWGNGFVRAAHRGAGAVPLSPAAPPAEDAALAPVQLPRSRLLPNTTVAPLKAHIPQIA